MQYTGICSIGKRHQLRLTAGVSRVNCHVRRAAVGVANGLDQSPTGAGIELEQRRLDGFGREVRQQVLAAVMSIAV